MAEAASGMPDMAVEFAAPCLLEKSSSILTVGTPGVLKDDGKASVEKVSEDSSNFPTARCWREVLSDRAWRLEQPSPNIGLDSRLPW